MKELTDAITARHAQIKQLQSDIEALQRAASVLGGKTATSQPKTKPKAKQKAKQKIKTTRRPWSAAARKAMSKKVKASWAKRRRAKRRNG